ncbi:MAG: cytochrome c oxidase subunit II, partial [Halobacteriaceae archaeon]
MIGIELLELVPLIGIDGGLVPRGGRVEVFQQIFLAFLVLGTLVGVVVMGYMVYNAYKYRDSRKEEQDEDVDRPQLGERPTGGGGGKKLLLSFSLSAIIVISLIVWTYGTLLYVEKNPPTEGESTMVINVEGYRFGWEFIYPNGKTSTTLRVPKGRPIKLVVTSRDVFHTFGIPALRVKADAIPGQKTDTWFVAN